MLQDPRMITVLGVLLGIDIQGFEREEGSDELPPGVKPQSTPSQPQPSSPASTSKPAPASSAKPKAAEAPKPEPMEVEEELDDEEAKAKKEALALKAKGGEAYKKRDFAVAKESYEKAWDTWPKDITFLTNLA
ncbi:Hsp90 cochaperone, partial [Tulasnella sp. 403]